MKEKTLKEKTVKGLSWSFADNIANSGVFFITGLILARLLSPTEFGILGMLTVFIAISNVFIDSGFSNALIRKINITDKDYNTAFLFNLATGILFFALLFFSAPIISRFFNEPVLIPVTRAMSSLLVINAFGVIQRTILVRNIDFKTQTKISLIASISSGVIGIVMAFSGFGVWSLVAQQISRQLLNSLLLWLFSSWRPRLEFSKESFKELFGFGSKLLVSGLIDTIYNNIYYVIIGRFYSSAQLGQYNQAERFSSIFSANLTAVVQRVSYPVLSSIQNEQERLRTTYKKIIKSTMLLSFTCMLGLAAVAKPMILILIGEKWLEAASYLQIICFSAMLYPLHAINLNILQVKGRSDLFLKLEIIKKIIGTTPIVLGIFCGIKIMLIASVFVSFLCYFLNSYYSAQLINYSTKSQLKDIFPTFVISILIAFVMWSATLLPLSPYVILTIQVIVGFALAILLYEKFDLEEYKEIKDLTLSFITKFKKK